MAFIKTSGVYCIKNTITNERYIGSSKDVKHRWEEHKCPSVWKLHPNSRLYQDFQKYGLESFRFTMVCFVEPEHLKDVEQEVIDMFNPEYNDRHANGHDMKRKKAYNKAYDNQPCIYNGEELTLHALAVRFRKAGSKHATIEARKYLV